MGTGWVTLDSLQFRGTPAYHAEFKVKSAPFFDIFFKMREDFHTWFTTGEKMRPLHFTRNTLEGNYTATNDYLYDWDQRVIHADVNFSSRGDEHFEILLHDCVYDLPALIFYLRTIDVSRIKAGDKYNLSFAIDDGVFDIVLTYHGPEVLKVRKMGDRKALKFTCSVVSGAMFEGNQELSFWMSDDQYHVPLGIMAPLRVGAVWAWLKAYQA